MDTNNSDSPGIMGISNTDGIYVSWLRNNTDDLFRAKWTGSAWSQTQLAGAGSSANCFQASSGLASGFSPDDGRERVVTWCQPTQSVFGAKIQWTSFDTGDPVTGNLSVAWIPNSGISDDLLLSTYNGSSWSAPQTVDTPAAHPSLGYAPDGTPWIAYTRNLPSVTSRLEVADWNGSTWDLTNVDHSRDGSGVQPSLSFKGSSPRVSYCDVKNSSSDGNLMFASLGASSWTVSTIASTNSVGLHSSLAYTSASKPQIAYWDLTNKDIRWAHT